MSFFKELEKYKGSKKRKLTTKDVERLLSSRKYGIKVPYEKSVQFDIEPCPECGSENVIKSLLVPRRDGKLLEWHCRDCEHKFPVKLHRKKARH